MIRVFLPYHLRTLACVESEVLLEVKGPPTSSRFWTRSRPAIRSCGGRFARLPGSAGLSSDSFACKEDLSDHPPDSALPEAVASGGEPFLVNGAIAGVS
jgi:molybdopterin synthase sulfur carrier subunit